MKKLNLGCGADIRDGWVNVDIQKSRGIDKSFDFNKLPYPLNNSEFDYVYLSNVLEHLDSPDSVLNELWRICKNGGIIEIIVPHYTNKGAYSDMQHRHFFNEICFKELVEQIAVVNKEKKFKILELKLTPTKAGMIFPKKLREKLSLFFNGIISQIHVKLKVLK